MSKEKKKKSFARRFFKWFFGVILSLVVAVVGFCLYLYFAKGINVINTIKELKVLNQQVNLSEISQNPWSESDLTRANSKIESISVEDEYLSLTDCEVGAYINNAIQNSEDGLKANIGSSEVNLVDYGFEIVEMTFDIPEDTTSVWTNFKLVIKIETTKFKSERLSSFPKNIIGRKIPDTIYFCSSVEIVKGTNADDYLIKSNFLTINNLNADQTKDLFNTLNMFIGLGDVDTFNKNISSGFVDAILGDSGIYGSLKSGGAESFNFKVSENKNSFVVYMIDTSTEYSISYENTMSAENSNSSTYKITDSDISLQNLTKPGYKFMGWFTQPNGEGTKVTQIDTSKTENVTLYAYWTIETYTITYNLNGGTLDSINPTTYTVETLNFSLNNPSKTNYDFKGWYTSENGGGAKLTLFDTSQAKSLTLYPFFEATKYSITYHTQGAINANPTTYTIEDSNFNLISVNKTGYTFNGWFTEENGGGTQLTEIVTSNAQNLTLYAYFTLNTYTVTYYKNGGTVSPENQTSYTVEMENFSLTNASKNGYIFIGWYTENNGSGTKVSEIDTSNAQSLNLYAYFEAIVCTITYHSNGGANTNPTSYTIEDSNFYLLDASKEGYTFLGWYTQYNGGGTKVTQIVTANLENIVLYADYQLTQYTITYNLNGGTLAGTNPTTYTVETPTFTLINPTKQVEEVDVNFIGWKGSGVDGYSASVTITSGSTGDRNYKAYFENDVTVDLTLYVDGLEVATCENAYGAKIVESEINHTLNSNYGLSGYTFVWYENEEMTQPLDFDNKIYANKEIFAKSTYITNNIRFYSYLTEFQSAVSSGTLNIDSHKKLKAYIDYVRFYDIKTNVKLLGFNYLSLLPTTSNSNVSANVNTIQSEINNAIEEITSSEYFRAGSNLTIPTGFDGSKYYGGCYVTSSNWSQHATNVFDSDKQEVFDQQDYALKLTHPNSRSNSFDNFNINNVSKGIPVSTSEQLVWVLENGYKPLPTSGSSAERMYNCAKAVLRQIVDSSMTDVQKLMAIYEWLILNIQYDNKALDESGHISAQTAKTYDSWYLEGVFNNQKAVCEGFAKALLVMAKIEGIPAIFVTGNNHAWNKVYVDGKWYGIDSTHGNVEVTSPDDLEILSYRTFMFKDSLRSGNSDPSRNFVATEYTSFTANTAYNFYATELFNYNSSDYDLIIESQAELEALFNYTKTVTLGTESDYYSIEFVFTDDKNAFSNTWIANASLICFGVMNPPKFNSQVDSNGNHIYNILVQKN